MSSRAISHSEPHCLARVWNRLVWGVDRIGTALTLSYLRPWKENQAKKSPSLVSFQEFIKTFVFYIRLHFHKQMGKTVYVCTSRLRNKNKEAENGKGTKGPRPKHTHTKSLSNIQWRAGGGGGGRGDCKCPFPKFDRTS